MTERMESSAAGDAFVAAGKQLLRWELSCSYKQ
jgi:hypothetical protein